MNIKSLNLKLKGMRKEQDFVVYSRSNEDELFKIQSDTYIARIDPKTGEGQLAGPYSSGAYFHHLNPMFRNKIKDITLTAEQLQTVKDSEAKKGQTIGNGIVTIG